MTRCTDCGTPSAPLCPRCALKRALADSWRASDKETHERALRRAMGAQR